MHIGIDLDNTLLSYDRAFLAAACRHGLVPPHHPPTKRAVRDAVRAGPGGERAWIALQADVYGGAMDDVHLYPGAAGFLAACRAARIPLAIVSHKTPHPPDRPDIDLRAASLRWLHRHVLGPARAGGLSADSVHFTDTRAEKVRLVGALGCTHFIDDLPEVFAEPAFPTDVERILFAPDAAAPASVGQPPLRCYASWPAITRALLGVVP